MKSRCQLEMVLKHGSMPKETIFSVGSTGLGPARLDSGMTGIYKNAFPFHFIYTCMFPFYGLWYAKKGLHIHPIAQGYWFWARGYWILSHN